MNEIELRRGALYRPPPRCDLKWPQIAFQIEIMIKNTVDT